MAGAEPFENPLIPNARLREMYLAILRARRLEEWLPAKRRAWTVGLEACLVAPAIDLGPADVISDAIGGATVEFLRGSSLGKIVRPEKRVRKAVYAGAGSGRALPAPGSAGERLWAAMGAAACLRARPGAGAQTTKAEEPEGDRRAVALVYLRVAETSAALRRSLFGFAAEHLLPVVFVVLPGEEPGSGRNGTVIAGQSGVPVIAVDRADAVAIYRVAQESGGRARTGGGPAVIECVPFAVKGQKARGETTDPLRNIERYILERAIVTPEWIKRASRVLATQLEGPVH